MEGYVNDPAKHSSQIKHTWSLSQPIIMCYNDIQWVISSLVDLGSNEMLLLSFCRCKRMFWNYLTNFLRNPLFALQMWLSVSVLNFEGIQRWKKFKLQCRMRLWLQILKAERDILIQLTAKYILVFEPQPMVLVSTITTPCGCALIFVCMSNFMLFNHHVWCHWTVKLTS